VPAKRRGLAGTVGGGPPWPHPRTRRGPRGQRAYRQHGLSGRDRARRLLRDFHRITSANGQIIAEAVDPYNTKNPAHASYQLFNRSRGRMSGQLRIRVRHGNIIGPWFDYLLVSRKEMKDIVAATGWEIARIFSEKGPGYTVVLKKTKNTADSC